MILNLLDIDIIFLSYDEPNAEKNYADLVAKIPWAKRVHGVKGSDSAHKAAANLSDTERFITVDADNIIDLDFFKQKITLTDETKDCVFSWCGKNIINGLIYGNGGLKCWTKDFVLNMKTHENSDPIDSERFLEFCFDPKYYQMNECFSTSYINGSPFQSWRAGFREGVKMSLNRGEKSKDVKSVWWKNYQRLLIWCNVGSDIENGLWAMYGARQGLYLTNCTDWDHINVRDFEYLTNYWDENIKYKIDENNLEQELEILGNELNRILKLDISTLNPIASSFFKTVYENTPRVTRN